MITFDDIRNSLRENEGIYEFSGGATDEKIIASEQYLGVNFPKSYKQFLKEYGTLDIKSLEIYGITRYGDFEEAGIPNAIWLTMQERQSINLPKELVIVYDTGMEFYFCLDTSEMKDGECPVVSIWNCSGGTKEVVYDSFPEFLMEECIEFALEEDDEDE